MKINLNNNRRQSMKRNKFQPGFTLIELIAVMVILAILAAVVIPRITSVQEGAYESNVGNMYGAIRNYVSNEALKRAISGGRGMETYEEPTETGANYYLDLWIKDYDRDKWKQVHVDNGGVDNNPNPGADANPDMILFQYHPHGVAQSVKKDVYFIEYFPATTASAEADNYNHDSFQLVAYKDDDAAGTANGDHDCDLAWDATKDEIVSGMHRYRPAEDGDAEDTGAGARVATWSP